MTFDENISLPSLTLPLDSHPYWQVTKPTSHKAVRVYFSVSSKPFYSCYCLISWTFMLLKCALHVTVHCLTSGSLTSDCQPWPLRCDALKPSSLYSTTPKKNGGKINWTAYPRGGLNKPHCPWGKKKNCQWGAFIICGYHPKWMPIPVAARSKA